MDLLTVVQQCHNDDPWSDSSLTPFFLSQPPKGVQIGFLPPSVVEAIEEDIQHKRSDAICISKDKKQIWLNDTLQTNKAKTEALKEIVESWRDRNLFPDPLKGWRNELYSIYGPDRKEAFALERSACALFGLATFGVHATAYTSNYKIWVPKRAHNKSTWPGYLDNSVAGGITAGDSPFDSMVRECGEEAGMEESLARSAMKQNGVISYFYRTKLGWRQPEVEYTYDILVPDSFQPKPVDGEAESFELMEIDQIIPLMKQGKFKPNCALVLIDFLIRHGFLTMENCDCDYVKLVCSLHNDLRLPGP